MHWASSTSTSEYHEFYYHDHDATNQTLVSDLYILYTYTVCMRFLEYMRFVRAVYPLKYGYKYLHTVLASVVHCHWQVCIYGTSSETIFGTFQVVLLYLFILIVAIHLVLKLWHCQVWYSTTTLSLVLLNKHSNYILIPDDM